MWSIIKRIVTFVFSLDQSQPLYVYFCPFIITISIIQIEESVDGVLGFEPGPQDGRRRRNHRAMVATNFEILLRYFGIVQTRAKFSGVWPYAAVFILQYFEKEMLSKFLTIPRYVGSFYLQRPITCIFKQSS